MWGSVVLIAAWVIGYAAGYVSGRWAPQVHPSHRRLTLPAATARSARWARRKQRLDISLALARPGPRFIGMPPASDDFGGEEPGRG